MKLPKLFLFPVGETPREKLKISSGERLRIDGLRSPTVDRPTVSVDSIRISVNDARKIMMFSQLQKMRSALKQIPTNSISYSQFLTLCIDICINYESKLAKSMEKLILQSMAIPNDPRKQQLEELEWQKAFIDKNCYPKFVCGFEAYTKSNTTNDVGLIKTVG
ncbi:hypothetical protein L6452_21944 [Arctium lappa]|uniref:Uncharacterized protein n=1 Tax=Arctium lappa TaxID=4217 RepID=A0ACB9AYG5_ARCLA|nr:hypothetical protein L6452_21944 [Arctium lappa]